MKIYIDNLNLNILNSFMSSLDEFHNKMETYIEVYSDGGIYQIDSNNNSLIQLKPVDEKYSLHKNYYNEFTLICDPSYFIKEQVSSIIGNILYSRVIQKQIYKMNKASHLTLVIEGIYKPFLDHPLQLNFYPNNIYFETIDDANNKCDINDKFFKQELTEFIASFLST